MRLERRKMLTVFHWYQNLLRNTFKNLQVNLTRLLVIRSIYKNQLDFYLIIYISSLKNNFSKATILIATKTIKYHITNYKFTKTKS